MFECNCPADTKTGILKGVHDCGCNALKRIYPEIWVEVGSSEKPNFPDTCPACGAAAVADKPDEIYERHRIYSCGGTYSFKSQIQNHTDKWWGSCGAE
jgi:hypothetical protein